MSAMIEWRKEFEVGIPEVDREHAELIAAINEAVARLGKNPPKNDVRAMLDDIYAKISEHFSHEEKLMEECGYDQYEDHKADHEFLLAEIGALMNSVDSGPDFIQGAALIRCVSSWFIEHCRTKDARLHWMLG